MKPGKIIAVTPPPTTGMTIVSSVVAELAKDHGTFDDWTFSRPTFIRGKMSWSAYKHIHLCARLVAAGFTRARSVYICAESAGGLVFTLLLCTLAKLLSLDVLLHHHSSSYLDRPNKFMKLAVKVGNNNVQHIALSDDVCKQFIAAYQPKRISALTNAGFVRQAASALPSKGPSRPNERRGHPAIGFLGRISDEKGFGVLEELLPELQKIQPNFTFRIAGPCSSPKIKTRLEKLLNELGNSAEYLGPLYGEEKYSFLRQLDLFLMPTQYVNEAQPLVIWEAAVVGTPTLAIERGDIANQLLSLGGIGTKTLDGYRSALSIWLEAYPNNQQLHRKSTLEAFERCADHADHSFTTLLNQATMATDIPPYRST